MRNKVPLSVARVARIGALLTVAVLAAVMMAGPAEAHHRDWHGGGGGPVEDNETATFTFDVSGDLDGNVTFTRTNINRKESSIHNVPPDGEFLELNMTGFLGNVGALPGWNECFAGGSFSGALQILADRNNPGTGSIDIWFTALGTDGTSGVDYRLSISAQIEDTGNWPYWLPADVGDSATVTGGSWEMRHGNGPGKKIACTGEGTTQTLDFTILVTRTD